MSRFRIVAVSLCALLFLTVGCSSTQGGKNAWKGTRTFYNRHINRPAQLDFDDSTPLKPYQVTLVEAVSEVDFELDELLRMMDDSDRSPDEEWSRELLKRFPWVSGVFLADGKGRVMSRTPAYGPDLPDFSALLELDPKQRPTDLRAALLPGADGTEVYLAKPVYLQSDLRVVIVCHFDMRALLARHGLPEKFVMLSGPNLLWPGVYTFSETPLHGEDWNKLSLKRTDGVLKNERGEFYWLSSFFANIQFIYAIPVKGDFTVNPQQLAVLRSPRFAGTGN